MALLYRELALAVRRRNVTNPHPFILAAEARRGEYLDYLCTMHLPHGNGFDMGCTLTANSTTERLVIQVPFHHMDDHGVYCGWTQHTVVVTPTFWGIYARVTGVNKRDVKDYIMSCVHEMLDSEVPSYAEWKRANPDPA
jgi:hypothetical protein